MHTLRAVLAGSLAMLGAVWLAGCLTSSSSSTGDPSGPPPLMSADIDVHRTAAPVTGNSFSCTGNWPSTLTPCGYTWTSQAATSAFIDASGVHLSLRRTPIPVDGGASMVFIDLEVDSSGVARAKAYEATTQPVTAHVVETSQPTSGWIDPAVTGVNPGARNAGQFSLTFSWGSIKGTYDTSQP